MLQETKFGVTACAGNVAANANMSASSAPAQSRFIVMLPICYDARTTHPPDFRQSFRIYKRFKPDNPDRASSRANVRENGDANGGHLRLKRDATRVRTQSTRDARSRSGVHWRRVTNATDAKPRAPPLSSVIRLDVVDETTWHAMVTRICQSRVSVR